MLLKKHIDSQELVGKLQTILTDYHRYAYTVDQYVLTSTMDIEGTITNASSALVELSGYSEEELINANHNILHHPDTPNEIYNELWATIRSGRSWTGEVKERKKDGSVYWVLIHIDPIIDNGEISSFFTIRQDITDKKHIEAISVTDTLTGALNRRHFDQNLKIEVSRSKRDKKGLCLLMVDVDHFKKYNDTYGHPAGDKVLQSLVNSMENVFKRAGDYIYRLGGEEFAVLFQTDTLEQAIKISNKLREHIYKLKMEHSGNLPYEVLTISGGLMMINPDSTYIEEEIYKYADNSLYQAKELGRNRIIVHQEGEVELFGSK